MTATVTTTCAVIHRSPFQSVASRRSERAARSVLSRRVARPVVVVRAATDEVDQEDDDKPPPGCSRYSIKVKRPLGLVLEEDKQGNIFVAEVIEDGNSAKTGLVNVGDQLLYVSAVVFNKTNDYGGVQVKAGEETIKFMTRGEKFDTVMTAIGTNPSQRLVTLGFQKCI